MTKNVEVRVDQEASRVRRRSVSEQSTSKGGREEDCFCDHKDEVGAIISAPSGRFATTLPQGDGTLNLLMDFESEGGFIRFRTPRCSVFALPLRCHPLPRTMRSSPKREGVIISPLRGSREGRRFRFLGSSTHALPYAPRLCHATDKLISLKH